MRAWFCVLYFTNRKIKRKNQPRTQKRRSNVECLIGGNTSLGVIGMVEIPEKLYRVGEVAEHTGVSRQMIHIYTTMGILRERKRTPGGHRLFGVEVFEILARVKELRERGWSLAAIKDRIDEEFRSVPD